MSTWVKPIKTLSIYFKFQVLEQINQFQDIGSREAAWPGWREGQVAVRGLGIGRRQQWECSVSAGSAWCRGRASAVDSTPKADGLCIISVKFFKK